MFSFDDFLKIKEPTMFTPNSLIMMGQEKCGKTSIAAGLTTDLALARSAIVTLKNESAKANYRAEQMCPTWSQFIAFLNWLIEANKAEKRLDFLIIDSMSTLDSWFEIIGTFAYMKSNEGKKFNAINPDAPLVDKNGKPYGIKYTKLGAYLIESIKSLKTEIEELKGKK
jgi:hypothetical protein